MWVALIRAHVSPRGAGMQSPHPVPARRSAHRRSTPPSSSSDESSSSDQSESSSESISVGSLSDTDDEDEDVVWADDASTARANRHRRKKQAFTSQLERSRFARGFICNAKAACGGGSLEHLYHNELCPKFENKNMHASRDRECQSIARVIDALLMPDPDVLCILPIWCASK